MDHVRSGPLIFCAPQWTTYNFCVRGGPIPWWTMFMVRSGPCPWWTTLVGLGGPLIFLHFITLCSDWFYDFLVHSEPLFSPWFNELLIFFRFVNVDIKIMSISCKRDMVHPL